MAKELALEQLPWNGCAIDSHQGALFASAAAVDFVGYQFFARSGLAQNEHRSFCGGDQVNLADDVPQGSALPDQIAEGLGLHHVLLQISILEFQLRFEPLNFLEGTRVGDGRSYVISENIAPWPEFLLKQFARG